MDPVATVPEVSVAVSTKSLGLVVLLLIGVLVMVDYHHRGGFVIPMRLIQETVPEDSVRIVKRSEGRARTSMKSCLDSSSGLSLLLVFELRRFYLFIFIFSKLLFQITHICAWGS